MRDWNDRSHLDDLAAEGRDARDAELRRPTSHHSTCRCARCLQDEGRDQVAE